MPYSITCSTKILTLAISQFLFILVGVLFEFAMVPGVYILFFPQRHIHQKDSNLSLTLYYYAKVIVELNKTQIRNSSVLWCL